MSAQASCPVIPSQCSHWVVRRSVAEVSTRSVDRGIVVTPVPPPSVREVARSAGGRDVDPPHPRCSSVGGDALIAPHTAPAVSFRASDRRHWRGNPFPAPAGAELPASLCERGGASRPWESASISCQQRPKAATYLCRFAAKARFDNRPLPRVGFPKGRGRTGRKPSERKIV